MRHQIDWKYQKNWMIIERRREKNTKKSKERAKGSNQTMSTNCPSATVVMMSSLRLAWHGTELFLDLMKLLMKKSKETLEGEMKRKRSF